MRARMEGEGADDARVAGGVRLLVTRPLAAGRRFLAACEAGWGGPLPAILSPLQAIAPCPVRLDRRPEALILTSENGAARAGELGLGALPAWCVGARTAAAARAAGLRPEPPARDADDLVGRLLAARPPGPLLHLRGLHARGDVAGRLRAAGLDAGEAVAYAQAAVPPTAAALAALAGPDPLVAPLFSPRSAALLAALGPAAAPLHVVALSRAVAAAAGALGPRSLDVAGAPDSPAMARATLGRLRALGLPPPGAGPGPGSRGAPRGGGGGGGEP